MTTVKVYDQHDGRVLVEATDGDKTVLVGPFDVLPESSELEAQIKSKLAD